jgi:hypothetical protein
MNLRRSSISAGRLAAAFVLTGAALAAGAGTAGAATVPSQAVTAMVPANHHDGGGHYRGGGGGHYRGGGGGHYRGGGGYYDGGCNPYYYGYYDLDNPTCD